ncbi:MAG TPA: helix-turn-helix domain-containing protein [Caulobacteraceae bacterium]
MAASGDHAAGSIRSVARALRLLRLINERQGVGLHDLHLLSGLPKPTVFRILLTLQQEGYLDPDGMPGVYHLTPKVCELSAGYVETSLIVKVAAPIALATTKRIKWPLGIGVLDGDAMMVRYSTMPSSPLAMQTTTLGHRHGLLESAMGRAYLGACSAEERQGLVAMLRRRSAGGPVDVEAELAALEAGAARGYGLRLPRKKGDSATLAVAIMHAGQVLAVLSLTTFGNLMDAAFIDRFLPTLRSTAQDIEAAFAAGAAPESGQESGERLGGITSADP